MFCLLVPLYFLFVSLPPLVPADVPLELQEVTRWHSSYKAVDSAIAKRALELVFDELDPLHCYFLEQEVNHFRSYPSEKLALEITKGDLTLFAEIYDNFGKAILRRRRLELMAVSGFSSLSDKEWPATEEALLLRLQGIKKLQEESVKDIEEGPVLIAKARGKKEGIFLDPYMRERHICCVTLKAVTAAFDPHTRYFTPQEAEEFLTDVQQQFYGIGVQIRESLGGFKVVKVFDEGPSFGLLHEGDTLIAIDGQPIIGLDIQDVVRLLKEPSKTMVTLTLLTQYKVVINKKMVRLKENRLEVKTFSQKGGIVAHITLHSFYQDDCSRDIEKVVQGFGKALKGIVLDLRGNMGGPLPQAISVAGLFLDSCAVVAIKDYSGALHVFRDTEGKNIFTGPLVILVDRLSASASELVAQTLQDWGRAIIIGDPHTFGKGTYQVFTLDKTLNPKGEFKITMGRYYTASGKSVQLHGVQPDLIVKGPYADLLVGEDYTFNPLAADRIDPLFDEDKWAVFKKKQQRLTCFTAHLEALKQRELPADPVEAALLVIDKVSTEKRQ